MNKKIALAFVLVVCIAFSVFSNTFFAEFLANPLPGLAFSVFVLCLGSFFGTGSRSIWRRALFVVVCTLAYMAAVYSCLYAAGWVKGGCNSIAGLCDNQLILGFLVAGTVGGLLFGLSAKILSQIFSWRVILFLTLLSAALGLLSYFAMDMFEFVGDYFPFLGLYLVWQGGMAIAIWNLYTKFINKNLSQI